jgi:hypothetical protein
VPWQWKQHFPDPNFKAEEIKLKCSYVTSGGDETTTKIAGNMPGEQLLDVQPTELAFEGAKPPECHLTAGHTSVD